METKTTAVKCYPCLMFSVGTVPDESPIMNCGLMPDGEVRSLLRESTHQGDNDMAQELLKGLKIVAQSVALPKIWMKVHYTNGRGNGLAQKLGFTLLKEGEINIWEMDVYGTD